MELGRILKRFQDTYFFKVKTDWGGGARKQ